MKISAIIIITIIIIIGCFNVSRGIPWRLSGQDTGFHCHGSRFDSWSGS